MTPNAGPIDFAPVLCLLEATVKEMCFHPDDVRITPRILAASLEARIQVNAEDTSRVIGRGAQTHRALSILFAAICRAKGFRFYLPRIAEPAKGEATEGFVFIADPGWPRERIKRLLVELAAQIFAATPDPMVLLADSIDEDRTVLELYVSPKESGDLVQLVRPELDRIFGGIGTVQGRKLAVDVIRRRGELREGEVERDPIAPQSLEGRKEEQPKSAAGRWAGEVP